jgi:HSP20 family protein
MRSLIPWRRRAWEPFERLREEMTELFRPFAVEPFAEVNGGKPEAWAPRVDVEETEKEILVKVDLPGVEPKDVELTVMGGALVIHGEKKEEKEEKKKNYHRLERFTGFFYREIPLPPGADEEKVVATSAKGVITVVIPKKPEVMPKKIAVKPVTV